MIRYFLIALTYLIVQFSYAQDTGLPDSLFALANNDFRKEVRSNLKKGEATLEMFMLDRSGNRFDYGMIYMDHRMKEPLVIHLRNDTLSSKDIRTYYQEYIYGRKLDTETYKRVWEYIDKLLQKRRIETLFLVSAGVYHQLNVETFYDQKTGKYMIDKYTVVNCARLSPVMKK